jgi:hypothetical protein
MSARADDESRQLASVWVEFGQERVAGICASVDKVDAHAVEVLDTGNVDEHTRTVEVKCGVVPDT